MQRNRRVNIAVAVSKKSEYQARQYDACGPNVGPSYKMKCSKYDAGQNVCDGYAKTMPQAPSFPAKPPLQGPPKYDLFKNRVNKNQQQESFWICPRPCRLWRRIDKQRQSPPIKRGGKECRPEKPVKFWRRHPVQIQVSLNRRLSRYPRLISIKSGSVGSIVPSDGPTAQPPPEPTN